VEAPISRELLNCKPGMNNFVKEFRLNPIT
jgi:hypothetical protein